MTKEKTTTIDTKLKLNNVKVIFANLVDEGFGTSITIDVTNPEIQEKITKWVKDNNIGKSPNAGIPNFKKYQPEDADEVVQYSFKLNMPVEGKKTVPTKFVGVNGLAVKDLGYGAEISLIANAFLVDNKFMKGTTSSLQAVLITKKGESGGEEAVKELLEDFGGDVEVDGLDF